MTPSSPAKRKRAGPPAMVKLTVGLKTTPVGRPCVRKVEPGIDTTGESGFPLASYSVDVPVPLLATHRIPVGPNAMPHGFTNAPSTIAAPSPPASATSDVRLNVLSGEIELVMPLPLSQPAT